MAVRGRYAGANKSANLPRGLVVFASSTIGGSDPLLALALASIRSKTASASDERPWFSYQRGDSSSLDKKGRMRRPSAPQTKTARQPQAALGISSPATNAEMGMPTRPIVMIQA